LKLLFTILLFVFMGNFSLIFAQENAISSDSKERITKEIIKIKQASPSQRVELMNKFKKKMALMNETQREEAVSLLNKYINRAQRSSNISAQKMIEVRRAEDTHTMQKQTLRQVTQYQTVIQKEVAAPKNVIPLPFPSIVGK